MTSQINANWSLPLAIVTLMFSAFFTCAGSGATFGIAPLLQRWVTSQIAGIVRAYGSVGVVFYAALPSPPLGYCDKDKYCGINVIYPT
ncbi:MAG: hypothetical protein H7237_05245 [Alkalinema sp. FL-bin-369]|nr:hypothetical protein [Leptolyngbyaceae cyanobacterium LF-bin-369]